MKKKEVTRKAKMKKIGKEKWEKKRKIEEKEGNELKMWGKEKERR